MRAPSPATRLNLSYTTLSSPDQDQADAQLTLPSNPVERDKIQRSAIAPFLTPPAYETARLS